MGKMTAVADRIIKRVRGKGRGWTFTPKDFLDLGTRASVDMALTRLVDTGHIRRISRGLYDYPKLHDRLGALTPDADTIVQAVATQSGQKVVASGAQSANRLGISTQVPAKSSYATSGATRVKKWRAARSRSSDHARPFSTMARIMRMRCYKCLPMSARPASMTISFVASPHGLMIATSRHSRRRSRSCQDG